MSKTFRCFTCDGFAKVRCSTKDNGRKVTSGIPEPPTLSRSLSICARSMTSSPDTSPIPPRSASSDPGPQVNIGILQRLGFVQTGKMLGDQLGWSEAWVPEPGRRLFFIIDLRDRRRPCAVLLVCDPGRQAHQLFALKRIKGRFGRQEYCFICPVCTENSNLDVVMVKSAEYRV